MINQEFKQECQNTKHKLEEDIHHLLEIIEDKQRDIQDLNRIINAIEDLERRRQ